MRDDMAKVVTERPRRGHGNGSKKTTGRRIRFYDPKHDYDEATRLPVARGRQYGLDCKEFGSDRPAAAISAVLHRETLEQDPQRTLTEAGPPKPERFAHVGSRAVGDRDGLLHRRRPTRVLDPTHVRAVARSRRWLVRPSQDWSGPRTASDAEAAVMYRSSSRPRSTRGLAPA